MPWEEYYSTPGQARGIQIDLKPDRLGVRYPVELGLAGHVKSTLQGLLPLLQHKSDRNFLTKAQRRIGDWNKLLDAVETTPRSPLRPQMVVRALSDLMADGAVISLDCGANTHFAALHPLAREPAHYRYRHACDDGSGHVVRDRRAARLPRPAIARDRR
jgi:pyruvate dehydrogenase (quinone)